MFLFVIDTSIYFRPKWYIRKLFGNTENMRRTDKTQRELENPHNFSGKIALIYIYHIEIMRKGTCVSIFEFSTTRINNWYSYLGLCNYIINKKLF